MNPMDDFDDRPIREQLDELYVQDDALRAHTARLLRQLEEQKRPPVQAPPAEPARTTSAVMTMQEQAPWDAWLKAHVDREFERFAAMLGDEVGKTEKQLAAKLREDFEHKLAELRSEMNTRIDKLEMRPR